MNNKPLYFVLDNGKVIAPFEREIDWIFDTHTDEHWYITKSGKLCRAVTYPDEIDFDDCLGRADYSHYTTERKYYGKVIAQFDTIDNLISYLKKKNLIH